jgi:two-component system response regulator HydG/two-component system response regulator AtoC
METSENLSIGNLKEHISTEFSQSLEKYKFTSAMLKVILEISANLHAASTFHEVGRLLFEGLERLGYAEDSGCKLGVYFEEEDLYEIVFFKHRHTPTSYFELKSKLKDLKMFTKLAVERGETILIKDSYSEYAMSIDPKLELMSRRTMIFIPLFHKEKLVGLFSYARTGVDSITGELKHFLECICKIVSIVIAELLGEKKRQKLEEEIGRNHEKVIKTIRKELEKDYDLGDIIAESPVMQKVIQNIQSAARSNQTILIEGATGTGKEVVAKSIHKLSDRKDTQLIIINCGSLVPNLIESELFGHRKGSFTGAVNNYDGKLLAANDGTVLLDEIGDLPIEVQAKLLRFLENGEIQTIGENKVKNVDIRVIAATNKDLEKMVYEGKFREDLYYRLKGYYIKLPLLRERKEDIPGLVSSFIKQRNEKNGLNIKNVNKEVLDILSGFTFHGNIRELKNIIEGACLNCREGILETKHLKKEISGSNDSYQINKIKYKRSSEEKEKEKIIAALKENDGNITKAANTLGVHRVTLRRKMERLGL